MQKIAKVIVDVSSHQTNQPYDYRVPEHLQDVLHIGSRVSVPFGARYVQGFVVDIVMQSATEYALKEIDTVLDIEPVLTSELIDLGKYMSVTFFSFLINCYKTMLPALLKASYDKQLIILDNEVSLTYFQGESIVPFSQVEANGLLPLIAKLKKENKVTIHYEVNNLAKNKMKRMVELVDKNVVIKKGAVQQQALYDALVKQSPQAVKDLSVSSQCIASAHKKGWVRIYEVIDQRDPYKEKVFEKTTRLTLRPQQQIVYQKIKEVIHKQLHQTFLLEGVTGSGKTEVYLQLIEDVLKEGKTAILLVPEIALTPQMVNHFKGRFKDEVAVQHSGLSVGERYDEWQKVKEKRARIVIGARSSIFAPLENIGIIIIDEEHESTYKQMDTVRYHARDIAIKRGEYHQCPVVLGSATPSLESRARAQKGVYQYVAMTERANQKALPSVKIIDMTKEKKQGNFDIISKELKEAIEDRLAKKEQVALLLNKRGYSSFVMCRDCGYVVQCNNCDISMTLHMDIKRLKCHYCGNEEAITTKCPKCFSSKIRYFGIGTQKVEEALKELIPTARVIRMDIDTTRKKGMHEKLLQKFGNKEADILLGTQMIAKGLDFPNITLVGVINADTLLNLPDFRATEKTYQLLTQVSGRAGRGDVAGEVIIQTYNPDHYVIQLAKEQAYTPFYKKEMQLRHLGNYPPYFYTTSITIVHKNEADALKAAHQIKHYFTDLTHLGVWILGPTAKSIARVNNHYYFQILLKYKQKDSVAEPLEKVVHLAQELAKKQLFVSIDVEPLSFI